MKVCGVIVEYNPMHNGHIYHLNEARKITGATHIVAIMSGNFVQRGEPSIINKWSRTKMALLNGVDLVIELPLINSISSAEGFCYSAVKILDSLNLVDNICFGSEQGSLDSLNIIANILVNEPFEYKNSLESFLSKGLSYPFSRQNALEEYIHKYISEDFDTSIISKSNNILSIEYLKAILKLNSSITPVTIERINNSYNERSLTGNISSATSIRKNIININDIKYSIPESNFSIINEDIENGLSPIFLDNFSDMILYKLRESSIEYLSSLLDVSEGLEFKIKRASEDFSTVMDVINNVTCKRYPRTRIQRILLYALFGITKKTYENFSDITYVRTLGFNDRGREILRKVKGTCPLPIISMPNSDNKDQMYFDILGTDIYSLGYKNNSHKLAKQDLKTPPIYIK